MAYDYNIIKDRLIQNVGNLTQEELKSTIDKLLEYMKLESQKESQLGHKPIYDKDFPDDTENSLFETINWRADLDAGDTAIDFDSILNNDETLGNDGIWNQSVKALINKYKDSLLDDNAIIPGTNERIKINDIKNANAGKSFNGTAWVNLNVNIDGETYDNVRGNDKIEQVLNSNNKLQFTINTINKYIRLIMPQYTRRVEVEDLNRNFWVIGQTLAGISAFLFDNSSPLKAILKQSISEIMQLWENILYLWAAVELLNKKKSEVPDPSYGIHYEVIDMPRAYDKPYRDINDFQDVPIFDGKEDWYYPFRAYAHKYPESCLCLLIRCRFGNYEKDYYHTEVYPYIVYYNKYSNKWSYTKLKRFGEGDIFIGFTLRSNSTTANDEAYNYLNLREHVYCMREEKPNQYYHYFPFNDLPPQENYYHVNDDGTKGNLWTPIAETTEKEPGHTYHAIIQIRPTIYATINDDKKIEVTTLSFEISDIARRLHFYGKDAIEQGTQPTPNPTQDRFIDNGTSIKYYDIKFCYKDAKIEQLSERILNENTSYITLPYTGLDPFSGWGTSDNLNSYQGLYENVNRNVNRAGYIQFSSNNRDSGFQGSLQDMLTYKGITTSGPDTNG